MKSIRSTLGAALLIFSSLIQFSSQSPDVDVCGKAAKQLQDPSAKGFIPAKVAYECLRGVPFHKDDATTTLQQIRLFLQFYSAQTYFAHPPTYELELYPVDMNKTLDNINSNIKDGKYADEYAFNKDLFDLFGWFRDGHVLYLPLCYTAFSYSHSYPLVSIAKTPDSIPEVYSVEITRGGYNIKDKVTKINGQDVISYLSKMANTHPELVWIDPDARWNQLMMHYFDGKLENGLFAQRYSYDNEDLIITWESGLTTKVDWSASLNARSVSFDSTDSFYSNVCVRSEDDIAAARTQFTNGHGDDTSESKKRSVPSLPHSLEKRTQNSTYYSATDPVMSMDDDSLGLYLLDDQVGVLTMTTFQPADNLYTDFSLFITGAISYLQGKGIKKIIIDVTGNGGGIIPLGSNAALQFFPTADHFFGTNMRWNHALETMLTQGADPSKSYWDIKHYHRMNGSSFSSYQEFLGPLRKDGDYFTEIARPDFVGQKADAREPLPASYPGPQPFDTNNIILLSSGLCGSTCAVFAEAMIEQGVRSIVFGGRPLNGPMQCVGGIKGSQVLSFDEITAWAYYFLGDDVDKYDYIPCVTRVATLGARVNLRNSWRKVDQKTPIEFIYTPAEYRLSYTPDMLMDPKVMWAAAKNVAWLGAKYLGNGTKYSNGAHSSSSVTGPSLNDTHTSNGTHTFNGTHTSLNSTHPSNVTRVNGVESVGDTSTTENKTDGINGTGVDDESDNDGPTGSMTWNSIGQLIWQKISGHGVQIDGVDLNLNVD